jgi:hypothetical protein
MGVKVQALFLLIGVPATACSSSSTSPPPVWSCAQVGVPEGERLECSTDSVQSAVSYTCNSGGDFNPNCPPPGAGADAGGGGGGTMDFSPDGGMSSSGSGGSSGGSGSSGGTTDAPDGGTSSSGGGCSDVVAPCGGSNSSGSGGGSSSSSGSTGGSNGGGGGGGGGPPWNCDPTATGVTCHQPPHCIAGTHPSNCGACVPDTTTTDCTPPSQGGCWMTGGGFITDDDGKDTFGGNAMTMKDGSVRGEWENIEHGTGDNLHGQANYIYCRVVPGPGPGHPNGPQHNFDDNQVYFGGPATYNGASGYWFDVVAEDHGEPGRLDTYQITIRQGAMGTQAGTVVFQESGTLAQGGNIQLHPPNGGHPGTGTPSSLPSWVQLQP